MDTKLPSYLDQTSRFGRRHFLKGVGYTAGLTVASGGLLAACGGTQASTSNTIAPKGTKVSGTITLAYLGTAAQQKSWQALFALFQKQYPDVKLIAQPNNSNNWATFFNSISTQIAGGKIPDLIQVATEGQRLFASRGLVEPIDAYIARDQDELADFFSDIDPHLKEWAKLSSTDGKTYYLPGEFNPMCMWYSTDLYQKAGLDEPDDTWTWDDFMANAKKLTSPGVYGVQVPAAYFAGIMPWLLTNGASPLNSGWTQSMITSSAAMESIQFMRDLVAQKISPLPGGTYDPFGAMAQGKLAMFGGGRWPIVNIRQLGFTNKVKIVAWPKKTQQGSPIGFNAYPIMQASPNKEAAWAFVKFITSKEASQYFAEQGGTIVPPRRSVATSDAFLSNAPVGSDKLYSALSYGSPLPAPDKENIMELAIVNSLTQILAGNVSVSQGVTQLNQQIQASLS